MSKHGLIYYFILLLSGNHKKLRGWWDQQHPKFVPKFEFVNNKNNNKPISS